MKKIMFLLIIVVILAAMVVPAFAAPFPDPPGRIHKVFDYPLVYCGDEIGVGDFWLWDHEEAFAFFTNVRYDRDGNMVQKNEHVDGTDMIYREGNPDKALNGIYHLNLLVRYDPVTEEPTYIQWGGTNWNIQIPGHGNVYHEAFNYKYPEDRQTGLSVYDVETLCEYFAS